MRKLCVQGDESVFDEFACYAFSNVSSVIEEMIQHSYVYEKKGNTSGAYTGCTLNYRSIFLLYE